MEKSIHFPITECPKCGFKEFAVRKTIAGECNYRYRFDGTPTYNQSMYDECTVTTIGSNAFCPNCFTELFPIQEYYNKYGE